MPVVPEAHTVEGVSCLPADSLPSASAAVIVSVTRAAACGAERVLLEAACVATPGLRCECLVLEPKLGGGACRVQHLHTLAEDVVHGACGACDVAVDRLGLEELPRGCQLIVVCDDLVPVLIRQGDPVHERDRVLDAESAVRVRGSRATYVVPGERHRHESHGVLELRLDLDEALFLSVGPGSGVLKGGLAARSLLVIVHDAESFRTRSGAPLAAPCRLFVFLLREREILSPPEGVVDVGLPRLR